MIRLWGRPTSVNVQKVLWALDELALPFAHVIVGGPHGGTDRPDFAALTPVRRVPVLEDGPLALWESHAILRHLARTRGGVIAPSETAWPVADQWMEYVTSTLQPPFIGLFWQMVRKRPQERSEAAARRHMDGFLAALDPLEDRLGQADWLGGEAFSIADIAAGTLFYRATHLSDPFDGRPALGGWYERLASRPAYGRDVMTNYDELRA